MAEAKLTDVNSAAPSSLRDMVGQESVVAQVAVALAAAFADGKRFDHALLVGPPGLGKSLTAKIIAAEMGTDLHEVLGQSIASPADLNGLLLAARDRDVIHLDECHELERVHQTALLMALDQRRLIVQTGAKSGLSSIPLADFSLLMSTTDEYGLVQPLRDRIEDTCRFVSRKLSVLGERGQQVGRVRCRMNPVQGGVVSAKVAFGLEVCDSFAQQDVITFRSHKWRLRLALGRGCEAECGERSLQDGVALAFPESFLQIATPFVCEGREGGRGQQSTIDPARKNGVGKIVAQFGIG